MNRQRTKLLVCGAHLSGMPLNHQLLSLDAVLAESTSTAPCYRLYALPGGPPHRPALVKVPDNGAAITVEIWSIPLENLGRFLHGIPAPLGLGKVQVADGSEVVGFICEPYAISAAQDITQYGGWRQYIESQKKSRSD